MVQAAVNGPTFSWFLPVRGDSRDPGVVTPVAGARAETRPPTLDYLTLVAQAAEQAGFERLLTPVGLGCIDPWVACASVAARTKKIGFLVAFRPTLSSPMLLAQQAQSFHDLHPGRIALNIVAGGDPTEQSAYGDQTSHDDRYAFVGESVTTIAELLRGQRVSRSGRFVDIRDAALARPPEVPIPLYLGGASDPALDLAARHIDTYLAWGEPVNAIAGRVTDIRSRAAAHGRSIRFGLRLHVLSRDTADEAWAEASRIQATFEPATITAVQNRSAQMDSVGQARMTVLHRGIYTAEARSLEVAPNLWAGIGLVRQGVGTAIVGSHQEVADRLNDYAAAGVDEFVLSGYPHLEEALRFGEYVAPLISRG